MIPDNVTLIVKAPNQQIEDQNVECLSSWTVHQLKGHLSEVYPSKPRIEEQKIIYSGQLLKDNIVLKDILRTYESQIAHTMHLVCAPNRRMADTLPTQDGLRRRNVNTPEAMTSEVTTPDVTSRPEVTSSPEVTPRPEVIPRPEMRQNDQNHTVEMQNYISSFVNNYSRVPPYSNYNLGEGYLPGANDPAAMANHMMMMQQAYLQYMQQYANMWQANQQAAPPAPQPAPAPAPEPPAEELEEGGRDWLEHIYAASRLAVLSSLVYLYGSGARLLLVLLVCLAGYLHQIGFFRDLNLNPQRNNNQRPAGNNQDNQPANRDNQPANQDNQPANQDNHPANQDNQPANDTVIDDQPSLFTVTWMIFTSFFASLIPDVNQ